MNLLILPESHERGLTRDIVLRIEKYRGSSNEHDQKGLLTALYESFLSTPASVRFMDARANTHSPAASPHLAATDIISEPGNEQYVLDFQNTAIRTELSHPLPTRALALEEEGY